MTTAHGEPSAVRAELAAKRFGALLDLVLRGDPVTITRSGRPVAIMRRWEPGDYTPAANGKPGQS